ncbi:MAG TPA: O-antigen ligase family protein, partial [Chroococcales cyanobacterium]
TEQKRVLLGHFIFWPAAASAAFGIFQSLFNLRFDGRWGPLLIRLGTEDGRANSIFFHPNILAGYLLLAIGIGFFLLERAQTLRSRWLLGGGLGLIFVCLVLTQSRSAWIGAALAIAAIGARAGRKVFLGILAGTLAAVALFFHSVLRRLGTLFSLDFFSNANRLRAWKSALRMISERPFFGFGPGTWGKVYPSFRDPLELEHLPHAHNMYLHLGAEYGLIPLFCLLLVLFNEIRSGLKKEGAWPIACVLVGFLLLNLFEFVFSEGRNSILFFAALALLPSPEKQQLGNG